MKSKTTNHCIKESNSPELTAPNVGCRVILLNNILAQLKLVNRSIGTIEEIIIKHTDGL